MITNERDLKILQQKIFGKLTVICKEKNEKGIMSWRCQCECGKIAHIYTSNLLRGYKSCGCLTTNNKSKVKAYEEQIMKQQKFGKLTVLCREKNDNGNTSWKCQCECGKIVHLYTSNLLRRNNKSCGCLNRSSRGIGNENPNWKGGKGKYINRSGYVIVWGYKGHPNAKPDGTIFEHRLVMSQILGRSLNPKETVHHKNGNRQDNRPENLELILNRNHHTGIKICDAIDDAIFILKTYKPESLIQELR